jgi:hypothetical protein
MLPPIEPRMSRVRLAAMANDLLVAKRRRCVAWNERMEKGSGTNTEAMTRSANPPAGLISGSVAI